MTAAEVLAIATRVMILVTAIVTLIDWVRHRGRDRFDIHLMFAALGGLVMAGQLSLALGHRVILLRVVALVLFLVQPYLLIRLVRHLRPVAPWVKRAASWSAIAACLSLLILKRFPKPVGMFWVVYFVALEGYAVAALLSAARRTRGANRWKCGFASLGSFALVVMFLAAGVQVFHPLSAAARMLLNQICAFVTGLSYLVAFAPPRMIRRSWQLSELHRFLVETVADQAGGPPDQSIEALCESARNAVGSVTAIAACWDASRESFRVRGPRNSPLAGTQLKLNSEQMRSAWARRKAVLVRAPFPPGFGLEEIVKEAGVQAVIAVPIATGGWTWGQVFLPLRKSALFVEDNLALIELMAERIARSLRIEELTERQQAMVRSSPFAMLLVSASGEILQANERTTQYLGYTAEELAGQPVSLLLREYRGPDLLSEQEAADFAGQRKDGSTLPLSVWMSRIRMEAQNVCLLSLEDITARRQAEDEARLRTEQMMAANRELEAFSYSVSHDLRAPLRAVDGFSQILEEDYAGDLCDDARHYLRVVRENTRKMGNLIDDLLAFSRLGRQPIRKQRVDMAELVRQVVEEVRGKNAGVVNVGALPASEGDPALLRQVMANLISNAIKFSRKSPAPVVSIGYEDEGGVARFFVKDNGVGFDMAYAANVFGVFQRLHKAEDYEGTGVGLAIVQRVIHRHGGRVWAQAQPGKGATFFFTLEGDDDGASGDTAGGGQSSRSGIDVASAA